jgi:hypothetical protein
MRRRPPNIRPESSALGMGKPISPFLPQLIAAVQDVRREFGLAPARMVLEYGCGQLRNLRELHGYFPMVHLVDTELQLNRLHDFGGKRLTVRDYVRRYYRNGGVTVMSAPEFEASSLKVDVIFSINVMDVVPPETRLAMLATVKMHLHSSGQFASLVPRNDSRTLNLCRSSRAYQDGHIFPNHGAFTFYKNWSGDGLQRLYQSNGLDVMRDLSRYRYSSMVCLPNGATSGSVSKGLVAQELAGRELLSVRTIPA